MWRNHGTWELVNEIWLPDMENLKGSLLGNAMRDSVREKSLRNQIHPVFGLSLKHQLADGGGDGTIEPFYFPLKRSVYQKYSITLTHPSHTPHTPSITLTHRHSQLCFMFGSLCKLQYQTLSRLFKLRVCECDWRCERCESVNEGVKNKIDTCSRGL
jgi:hypothetical protein